MAATSILAPLRLASSRMMPRSLRIQSTAKPNSNLPSFMVFQRLSICQDWAAPLEMVSITLGMSRPAFCANARPSETPCTVTATMTWLTILVSWPEPEGPISVTMRA